MYSMMRNSCLGVSMISYNWMMLGCLISFRMWISRDTRYTSATSTIFSFSRILTATFSPVRIWMAALTLPKVPLPRVLPGLGGAYQARKSRWFWCARGLVIRRLVASRAAARPSSYFIIIMHILTL